MRTLINVHRAEVEGLGFVLTLWLCRDCVKVKKLLFAVRCNTERICNFRKHDSEENSRRTQQSMAVLGESFDLLLITEPCCHFPGPYQHILSYYYGDGAASGIRGSGLRFATITTLTLPILRRPGRPVKLWWKLSHCADTQNYNYIFKRLKLTRWHPQWSLQRHMRVFHPVLHEIRTPYTNSLPPSRFRWDRSCVSSPPCPPSRCPLWLRPYRATWGPWSPCCPPRSSATPGGWCRSLAGRVAWARSCRKGWRRESETRGTGSVSALSLWEMWRMLQSDMGVFLKHK